MIEKKIEFELRKMTVLCRFGESGMVVMHAISEKEEEEIRKSKLTQKDNKMVYQRADKEFKEQAIFAFGEMNLRSEVCLDLIEKLPILSPEVFSNSNWMPSTFDFKNRLATTSENGQVLWTQTWDKVKWFKYHYALIGNPKRVIVYRIDGHDLKAVIESLEQ